MYNPATEKSVTLAGAIGDDNRKMNTVANFPSFVVPYLALWLRRRFGSFLPICAVAAGFKMLAVAAFLSWGQVTPVKTTPKD